MNQPSGDRHWTRRMPGRIKRAGESKVAALPTDQRQAIRAYVATHPECNRSALADQHGITRSTLYRILKEPDEPA